MRNLRKMQQMRRVRRMTILTLTLCTAALTLFEAQADMHGGFADRVQAALDEESRPAKDKARDGNRLPKETLAFFGVESDQRVLELLPGGGWYTRLLAPALEGTGQLYLAFDGRMSDEFRAQRLMKHVESLKIDATLAKTEHPGIFGIPAFEFGVKDLDTVLTFRNAHNMTPTARANLNRAVFMALRPGGVYGIIDHTRRHNEPDKAENWRRLDPVMVIEEAQAAGFVFEASNGLHARPSDALALEVGDESVTGKTDRFTLKFRKPAN